jgi:hypothetical protein
VKSRGKIKIGWDSAGWDEFGPLPHPAGVAIFFAGYSISLTPIFNTFRGIPFLITPQTMIYPASQNLLLFHWSGYAFTCEAGMSEPTGRHRDCVLRGRQKPHHYFVASLTSATVSFFGLPFDQQSTKPWRVSPTLHHVKAESVGARHL